MILRGLKRVPSLNSCKLPFPYIQILLDYVNLRQTV
jgi:hypothetical protein